MMADKLVGLGFVRLGAHVSVTDNSLNSVATLAPATGATKLLIQALTQNVRYTLDGTTPSATVGFQLKAGDPPLLIPLSAGVTVKVIEETASAVIQYQWGK